ncbi:MAG: hypothetical protein L3J11_08430 [Draconibacterium sp.]|nr:hypothetical protein [Draconibacterium sp.]
MTTEKIDINIRENLFSTNTETTIYAINKVKEKGNKLYLPILFDLLNSDPEKEVEDEIKKLLATIKDKGSVGSFIQAVEDKKYRAIQKSILVACWQNGLDFSEYLPVFVDKVITEDWEIAFEAFTIIDNLELFPDKEIIDKTSKKIKTTLKTANEQKSYFLHEILTKIS